MLLLMDRVTTALGTVIGTGAVLHLCTPWLLDMTIPWSLPGVAWSPTLPQAGDVLFWAIEASTVPAALRFYRGQLAAIVEMRRLIICRD